ncbi:MAG: hypothetical protein IAC51_06800 [bacterium]|uniref:Beta-hexosaminidase bacterial type N-terminal domain-containing protein n=1 Tax=Candidatus Aphodosoma intestinipullorum TaxID=2840674 RepID=A0A940DK00_9BACT|nr:hypothetical protein [Candidatus Aphodosoma intestinipullorum]
MKVRFLMLVCLLSCGLLKAQIIVPMPVQYEFSELGSFVVDDKTVVEISDESLVFPAQLFSEKVKEMCGLDLLENNRGRKKVKLKINSYMSHPDSYHISVNDKAVQITGGSEAGVYYGVLMLIQCMSNEYASVDREAHTLTFPLILVEDTPLFTFRALEWEDSYVPTSELKKRIERMSELNLNTYVVPMEYNEMAAYVLSDKQKWYGLSEYATDYYVNVVPKVIVSKEMLAFGADSVASIMDRIYDIFPSEFVQMEFGDLNVDENLWNVIDERAQKRQKTLVPDKTAVGATMVSVPFGRQSEVNLNSTIGEIIVIDLTDNDGNAEMYNVAPIKRKRVNKTFIPLNGVQFVVNTADKKDVVIDDLYEFMPFCSEAAWTKSELKSFDDFGRRKAHLFKEK